MSLVLPKLEQEKHADIQAKLGDSFKELGDTDVAKAYYTELVEKHPKSKAAEYARSQLSKLKKPKS